MIISLDTETTGLDFNFGAKPFLVTTCDAQDQQQFWEWDVDPLTRQPSIPDEDIAQIQDVINNADHIVLHNSKFDCHALTTIGIVFPWHKVYDTLMASHLLASNHRHNLTDVCIEYLGYDIEPYEKAVKAATEECRRIARRDFPEWRIAKEGDPMMPSVKGSSKRDEDRPSKNDMWLPRVLILVGYGDVDNGWWTVTSEYANADSAVTMALWKYMEVEIKNRGLWEIYLERLKLLPIAFDMEQRGVTISRKNTDKLVQQYTAEVEQAALECITIAADYGHELELPAGASPNDSLREMFFGSTRLVCPRCGTETKHKEWMDSVSDTLCKKCAKKGVVIDCNIQRNPCFDLQPVYNTKSKSAAPTLDKGAMDHYEATLEPGPSLEFVKALKGKRSRDTALAYIEGYKRFWIPEKIWVNDLVIDPVSHKIDSLKRMHQSIVWFRLHPSLNPTGTDHLRWSSSNPNAQNISKKESFNLRYCFGPMPGREWWSMDGKNLELRIPAYESGEQELIDVFDHPDDPPYYGSYHLVVFDTLHPEMFAEHGKKVKDLFESTWYQWIKNGNFAVIYGCQEKKADATYHVPGAYKMVQKRFPKIAQLSDKMKALANKYGYVETIPDRTVCAERGRGYPILASRTEDGRVSPTTPLNYHVSGTAMQWTNTCMIYTDDQLREWRDDGWDGYITMQVHDELVFDVPRGIGVEPWRTNLPRIRKLRALMESAGDNIGVPTPVSMEYHAENWSTGLAL